MIFLIVTANEYGKRSYVMARKLWN